MSHWGDAFDAIHLSADQMQLFLGYSVRKAKEDGIEDQLRLSQDLYLASRFCFRCSCIDSVFVSLSLSLSLCSQQGLDALDGGRLFLQDIFLRGLSLGLADRRKR